MPGLAHGVGYPRESLDASTRDEVNAMELAIRCPPRQASVVTLGERAALMIREGGSILMDAASVSAVDTAGAGDASFVGARASKMSTGCAIEDAVRCAVDVASVSVTARGTQASYPTLEALPDRMQGVGRRS